MKRSGKFYYKNEREVMESLGMKQVPGSGNSWISKEDGESEFLLCQLKSTDANSIRVQQLDIHKLVEHAAVSKKYPLFAIQFLNTNEVWLMARPDDFADIAEYIKTGHCEKPVNDLVEETEKPKKKKMKKVVSSSDARQKFHEQEKQKYVRNRSAT